MNSSDLFYVRYLQLKTFTGSRKNLSNLFLLESEIFRFYPKTEEIILSKIKLKWFYEEVEKRNKSNFILKNFDSLELFCKDIKFLILKFDEIIDNPINMKTLNLFKDFNIGYEKLTKALKLNFDTSYFFQLIYMIYANEIKINKSQIIFLTKEYSKNQRNLSRLERIFVELFLNQNLKKKISRKKYLYYIIKSYFHK